MKIVLFCRHFSPDFEYMQNAYVREFQKMGHDVTILTTTRIVSGKNAAVLNDPSKKEREPGAYVEQGVPVVRLKPRYLGRNGGIELLPGLKNALEHLKPDLLFFQSVENFPIALQTAVLKYIIGYEYTVVVNEHYIYALGGDSASSGFRTTLLNKFARICKWISLKAADKVIGMNEYSSEAAVRLYKGSQQKMINITLGVDSEAIIHRPEKRLEIRNQFQVKPDEMLFVHSGKMAPYKKTHLILEALSRLGYQDVKLLLIGKCEEAYREQIDHIIREGQMEGRVMFVPWVASSELHHYYSAADAAVWVDHATISTIEASAVGIPVVVPDFHGYQHRTKNENGLRIRPGNLDDLIERLEYLITNRNEAVAMGQRGRELVEEELNWDHIVQKILI